MTARGSGKVAVGCAVFARYDGNVGFPIAIGNRMIRLCCWNCVRVVRQNPGQYLKMVDFSNREAAQKREKAQRSQPPTSAPDA